MKERVPVEKNKTYIGRIVDFGSEGQGVAKIEDFTVFVEEALPGELCEILILKVQKNFAFGKCIRILEEVAERADPKCPIARRCGGCSLQHMTYELQLKFKQKRVQDALERIGGFKDISVLPTIGMEEPYYYRNKAQLPVRQSKEQLAIGFYAKRSHTVIDCENCRIQHRSNEQILSVIRKFILEYEISVYSEEFHRGLIRHILIRTGFSTGEIMVCFVMNGDKLPHSEVLINQLKEIPGIIGIAININKSRTNVILGDKIHVLWGKGHITDTIGGIQFEISPLSFFQVNPIQTEILYQKALEFAQLSEKDNVLDLYCGIGTISLFMAQKAKQVLGIEVVPEAVADAKHNAEINSITNVDFKVGKAEDVISVVYEDGFIPHVIVVDPPRKGCEQSVLETIVQMNPKRIVYVSCEPSTLARDLKFLAGYDWCVEKVQPVDQFCQSAHVECVVLMSRKNG